MLKVLSLAASGAADAMARSEKPCFIIIISSSNNSPCDEIIVEPEEYKGAACADHSDCINADEGMRDPRTNCAHGSGGSQEHCWVKARYRRRGALFCFAELLLRDCWCALHCDLVFGAVFAPEILQLHAGNAVGMGLFYGQNDFALSERVED